MTRQPNLSKQTLDNQSHRHPPKTTSSNKRTISPDTTALRTPEYSTVLSLVVFGNLGSTVFWCNLFTIQPG